MDGKDVKRLLESIKPIEQMLSDLEKQFASLTDEQKATLSPLMNQVRGLEHRKTLEEIEATAHKIIADANIHNAQKS